MPILTALRDLLAPPACLACGAPGADVCAACRRALPWLAGACCRRCGLPGSCGTPARRLCPAARLAFDAAWAPVAYGGPARELVGALKFRRIRVALEPMAAAMARAPVWLLAEQRADATKATPPEVARASATTRSAPGTRVQGAALVPVPTAQARVRARGFDQAAALATALQGRGTGRVVTCLERGSSEARQLGAGRAERLSRGRLDVQLRPGGGCVPTHCVLVDDVHTTGATLDACARVLKDAGARRVVALTYARALP